MKPPKTTSGIWGIIVLGATVLLSCQAPPAPPPTWLSGYQYRVPITIQECSGYDLTDFQVRIEIQGANANEINCVDFSRIQPDGADICLTDSQHRPINFWIKSWNNQAKTAVIWVKVPHLPAGQKAIVYLYYGTVPKLPMTNDQLPRSSFDQTMTKLTADAATRALWHLDEGTNGIGDSSPNKAKSKTLSANWLGKDGGQFGASETANFTRGNALVFDGQNNYAEVYDRRESRQRDDHSSLDFTGQDKISLEMWVKPLTPADYAPVLAKPGNYALYLMADGRWGCYLYGPKPEKYYFCQTALTPDKWSHLALTYNGDELRFYLNGHRENTVSLVGAFQPCMDRIHDIDYRKSSLYLGYDPLSPGNKYWAGMLDEVRILDRVLPSGEVTADYERRQYARIEPEVTVGTEERQ